MPYRPPEALDQSMTMGSVRCHHHVQRADGRGAATGVRRAVGANADAWRSRNRVEGRRVELGPGDVPDRRTGKRLACRPSPSSLVPRAGSMIRVAVAGVVDVGARIALGSDVSHDVGPRDERAARRVRRAAPGSAPRARKISACSATPSASSRARSAGTPRIVVTRKLMAGEEGRRPMMVAD